MNKRQWILLLCVATTLVGYTLWQKPSGAKEAAFSPSALYDTCYQQPSESLVKAKQVTIAGEIVPLKTRSVRKRFERELAHYLYYPTQTSLMAARAKSYFKVINPIFKKHKIPRDFRYIVAVESGFDHKVVSRRGATGLWQMMRASAQQSGLTINHEVDERLHLEKSTEAVARHLKYLYRETGSWTSALAAYNCGITRYKRNAGIHRTASYYKMGICRETSRYVFKVMAIKELMERPAAYGLEHNSRSIRWPETKRVQVAQPIASLTDFARTHHTDVTTLRELNPWLVGHTLTPTGKPYTLLLSRKTDVQLAASRIIRADSADGKRLVLATDSVRVVIN